MIPAARGDAWAAIVVAPGGLRKQASGNMVWSQFVGSGQLP